MQPKQARTCSVRMRCHKIIMATSGSRRMMTSYVPRGFLIIMGMFQPAVYVTHLDLGDEVKVTGDNRDTAYIYSDRTGFSGILIHAD